MSTLIKERLKNHPDHIGCDFGKKEFNKIKRNKEFVEEANLLAKQSPTGSTKPPCVYVYSDWSPCVNGRQTRSVLSKTPKNCTGSAITSKSCTQQSGVILLDFDGYTVSGTSWNYAGDIICAYSGLTLAEQQIVIDNVVAEYAPYDVMVTTDEAIYNATAATRRMRCIITETWEWYGQAGGVAFINSFTWGDNTPCFVFSSLLGYNTKQIKEAAAHEVGHTLGLYHQSTYDANCVKTSEYNYGNGVECPIMGAAYYVPDAGSKWWIGPTPYGCTSIQDDNAILTTQLGLK